MGLKPVFTATGQTILTNQIGQVLVIGADGRIKFDWRKFEAPVFLTGPAQGLTVGNGAAYWEVGEALDGAELTGIRAYVVTESSSGNVTAMIHDVAKAIDILSTGITIEANEHSSTTAATQPVIGTPGLYLYAGQVLRFDIDSVGTGSTGLQITLMGRMGVTFTSAERVEFSDTVLGEATIHASVSEGLKAGDTTASAVGMSLGDGLQIGDTMAAGLDVTVADGVKIGDSSSVSLDTRESEGIKLGDNVQGEKT